MPKKVITRRQRKAAEAKRKAEEDAVQYQLGQLSNLEIDEKSNDDVNLTVEEGAVIAPLRPENTLPATPQTKEVLARKKSTAKMMQPDTVPGMQTRKESKAKGAAIKTKETPEACKFRKLNPKANNTEEQPSTSAIPSDYDQLHGRAIWYGEETPVKNNTLNNDASGLTASFVVPLMTKICKQIKSHWNTVLPKRSGMVATAPRQSNAKGDDTSTSQALDLVQLELQKQQKMLDNELCDRILQDIEEYPDENVQIKGAEPSPPPEFVDGAHDAEEYMPAPHVFGNTGYFMLTGTDEQLAQQLADIKTTNIVLESYLMLPPELMDKVEQQLGDLVKNREQILEKMQNKHLMLASPRVRRSKKTNKHKN
ncbi:hypothetical protein KR009_010754 [Drosophila setifemur]|nr:hypothetical protein KR009_010754 [Drosophila setifemur]